MDDAAASSHSDLHSASDASAPGASDDEESDLETAQARFRAFVDEAIRPHADHWHREAHTPPGVVERLAENGLLGATLPAEHGGGGMGAVRYATLMEELGAGCSSIRSLVTVHCMASEALQRWGSKALRETWIPRLASGDVVAGYALSEPDAGSDASAIATTAAPVDGDSGEPSAYVVNGEKKWTTYGQIAGAFLVFARIDGDLGALWVESDRPGLSVEPMHGLTGARASMPARVFFDDCHVPASRVVGRPGFGFSALLTTTLTHGRLAVAAGCVGLARACLQAAAGYTRHREQFGNPLEDYQLVQRKITNLDVRVEAARLMSRRAARQMQNGAPEASTTAAQAKYFAADVAVRAANEAVELHGGNGCHDAYSVHRYLADAKVMEVIEGTPEVLQTTLADAAYRRHADGPDADSRAGTTSK
jgi:alkylation response protein AidB-like acyl-CoA dehydrogenase